MIKQTTSLFLILGSLASTRAPAAAQDAQDGGFEDLVDEAAPPSKVSEWTLQGMLRSDIAFWTERISTNPFAKARQSAELIARNERGPFRLVLWGNAAYDLAYLVDRQGFDSPTLRAYEWKILPREAYAALARGPIQLVEGFQVITWGHGELVSALDVISPRDLREPSAFGVTSTTASSGRRDDERMPIWATRLVFFAGDHQLDLGLLHYPEAIALNYPVFGLRSPPGGPFSPWSAVFSREQLVDRRYEDEIPSFAEGMMFRWRYVGRLLDLGLYVGSLLDQQGVLVVAGAQESNTFILRHDRMTIVGFSGSLSLQHWQLRGEFAWEPDHPFNVELGPAIGIAQVDRKSVLLGLAFIGIRDLRISAELLKPWLSERASDLVFAGDVWVVAARVDYFAFENRLKFVLGGTIWDPLDDRGSVLRFGSSWQASDELELSVDYISYSPREHRDRYAGFRAHNRLSLGVQWNFLLL